MHRNLLKKVGATCLHMALSMGALTAMGGAQTYYRTRRGSYGAGKNQYITDPNIRAISTTSFSKRNSTINDGAVISTSNSDFHFEKGKKVRELLIVDASVQNKSVFFNQTKPGVEVVEIEAGQGGINSLLKILAGYSGLDAVHIISHAQEGVLQIGGQKVDQKSFENNVATFATMNNAIREGGDLMLYGCDLAKGSKGEDFLEIIKSNTHVDVAASIDKTGNAEYGGNWDLEIQKGDIETSPLPESVALKDFTGTLQFSGTIDFTQYVSGSGAYNDPGSYQFDAQFYESPSKNYILTVDGSTTGTYQWGGYQYVVNAQTTETSITLRFTNNESFTPNSISVFNFSGSNTTFYFTTNAGGSVSSSSIANNAWEYNLDINALPDNVTSLTITGSQAFWVGIDDFQVSNLQDVAANTAPAFESDLSDGTHAVSIEENSPLGKLVYDVDANDGDGGGTDAGVTYSITAGNTDQDTDNSLAVVNSNLLPFKIDHSTGEIIVNDPGDLDFEGTNTFNLTIQADDGTDQTTATLTINLTNQAESGPIDGEYIFSTSNGWPASYTTGTTLNGTHMSLFAPGSGTIAISTPDEGIWLDNSTDEATGTIRVTADGTNLTEFDLADVMVYKYSSGVITTGSFSVNFTGHKSAGSTVTTSGANTDGDPGWSTLPDFSDFTDLDYFDIEITDTKNGGENLTNYGFHRLYFANTEMTPPNTAPTITTTSVSIYQSISATMGGNITADGGASVTEKGVVYSTTDATPEIGEAGVTKDDNGSGTGTFSESITGLSASTTYYVSAYATNSEGTSYGSVESFTTTSSTGSIIITSDASSSSEEWSLTGGILKPLKDGAKVNLSEVQTALASGALQIQAPDDVIIDTDITISLSAEQNLTLKADGNVIMNPGASISATSSALNMIFWSDADGDEDGVVWLNWDLSNGGTTINTNGGDLWMGGGSGTVTWNSLSVGDDVARGNSSNANGITLIQSTIQTHGGNMAFYGRGGTNVTSTIDIPGTGSTTSTGNDNDGIQMFGGNNIDADGGKIYMYGYADAPTGNGNGVELSQESSGGGDLISSSNSADDAIVIEGYAEDNSSAGNSWGFYTHYSTVQNIGGGGIHIKGSGAKNSGVTVATDGAILANSGKIILEGIGAGSGQPVVLIQGAVGQKAGTDITTSSADIEIIGNELSIAGSTPNGMVSSSGILTIRPYTAGIDIGIGSGSGTLQLPASYFSTNFVDGFSDIIVGDENAGLITIDGATIYNDSLTLKTDASIVFTATADISSTVANALTLWSRASGTNEAGDSNYGAIWMGQGSSINTAGGNLTMGGGEDPLIGYAMGDNSAPTGENNARYRGVCINGSIDAVGGNIIINGRGASNITNTRGVSFGGTVKTEGVGNITVKGIGRGASDAIALGDSYFSPDAVGTLEAETGNIILISEPSSSTRKGLNISTSGSYISTEGNFSTTTTGRIIATSGSLDIGGTTYLEAGADIVLTHANNDFDGSITVNGATDVQIVDQNELSLGEISVSGTIEIATQSGDLMLNESITTTDATSDAIKLFADKTKNAGDATGGNIKISGTPTINTGAGGQAKLYSGSENGSADLITLVGEENTRYNVDATTTIFDPVLSSGNYALIRELATPSIQFNIASSSGLESVSSANLQVDLSSTASENVTVDYTISGTATGNGTDYTLAGGTLTITTGNTSSNISIAGIVDDAILETNETVIVTLSNPSSNAKLGAKTVHTYTITNDDDAAVTIADISGNEDDGGITVTATLDHEVQGGFTVDVSTSDGTATTGESDYTAVSSQTLTFAGTAGETQTFTFTPTVDTKLEANETVAISQSNLASTTLSIDITDGATVTINNDDAAAVTIADISGNEDDGAITLTATLDHAVQGGFTVDVSSSNGTATAGTDYTAVSGQTLTFAGTAGEIQNFTVTPTVDSDAEFNETLTISQSNLASTALSVDITDEATVTIIDDDVPQITAGNGSAIEGNAGPATISFEVKLDRTSPGTLTVDYETEDGTAIAGSDYTSKSGTLTFASGETTKTVDVTVSGDEILEANEFFRFNLSNLTGTANLLDDAGTGTITNDDAAAVTIADVSGNEDDGAITVTATLDNGVQGGFTIDVSTADGTATTGDSDYTSISSQTITFAGTAGETQTFTVTPTTDTKLESDETLTIDQSNLFGTTLSVDISDGATVTISNDDAAAVTLADVSGNEDDGAITLTATLDNAVQGGFTVDVSTSDGTATAGSDYTAVSSQTLTFAGTAGESQTLTVTPTVDSNPEQTETIDISLSNLTGTSLGVDITDDAVMTIVDDDDSQISIDDPTITEGNSGTMNLTFTVSLDQAGPATITVDYATSDGSATSGSDYTAKSGTLTFAAGETSKVIDIVVSGDKILETDEALTITLSNVSGIAVISDATGSGTITDDDEATVTIADVSGNEDDGAITVTATLDNGVQGGFTIDVSTADGTATTGDSDYTAVNSQTLTFTGTAGETQTYMVTPDSDSKLESDETLSISQSNLSGTTLSVDISDGATVTISNDDEASVTIANISSHEDDGSITVTATLDNDVDGGFTVDVSITDGTATAGSDYTAVSSQTLTFTGTAGETKTFIVTPTADTEMESDETLTISQSNLTGTTLGVDISDNATVTITNDDNTPVITASQSFSIIEETANGTSVGTVQASDADTGTTLQNWLISGGNTDVDSDSNPAFVISSSTGEITVNDSNDLKGGTSFVLELTVNDGVNISASETVTISIGEVNDSPSFTQGSDQTVTEDAGAQTIDSWATAISAGPEDENDQTLTFEVTNDNNDLFSTQPAIAANGTLTYTAEPDAFGIATVTVSLSDDGGTDNGGDDTSDEVTFTITVTPVNDAPSFTAGSDPTVPAGAASHHLSGWASDISAGPANESSQQLTFQVSNDNNAFFTTQPAINGNGDLSFKLAEGVSGTVILAVSLSDDGGTANEGDDTSDQVTFTINIGKLSQTITFEAITDKMVGQDPVVLTASGGDSGLLITYTLTTDPAAGVATLVDNTIIIENVGTVTVTASQAGNDLFEAAEDVSQTFNISANELFLPTLFTPNGDGNNDSFILRGGGGVAQVEFSILDRDNNLVFHTASWEQLTESGWDGKLNGKAQPLGTYVWVINGKYTNGLPLLVNGNNTGIIRLLR